MYNQDLITLIRTVSDGDNFRMIDSFHLGAVDVDHSFHQLRYRLTLPPGFYKLCLRMRKGTSDVEVMRSPRNFRVFPSGETKAGPLTDLCRFEENTVVPQPTMNLLIDGVDLYDIWMDLPNEEQLQKRFLKGEGGFEVVQSGRPTEIALKVPETHRGFFNLSMLETIELRVDERQITSVTPKPDLDLTQPWALISSLDQSVSELPRRNPELWEQFRTVLTRAVRETPEQFGLWDYNGTRVVSLCFLYLAEKDPEVLAAIKHLLEHQLEKKVWGLQPDTTGRVINGENDQTFGIHLYGVAAVHHYLRNELPSVLRGRILTRMEEKLTTAYRAGLVARKQYGQGSVENHSSGFLSYTGIACLLMYPDLEIARHALPWFHGRLLDSLKVAPSDGSYEWTPYGAHFLIGYFEHYREFSGERVDTPFFQNLIHALIRGHYLTIHQNDQMGMEMWRRYTACYSAGVLRIPAALWYYRRVLSEHQQRYGEDLPISIEELLWQRDGEGSAPKSLEASSYFAESGRAYLQTNYEKPRFAARFVCGESFGLRHALCGNQKNNELSSPNCRSGAISVYVRGQRVIAGDVMSLYEGSSLRQNSAVTIDDGGYFTRKYSNSFAGQVKLEHIPQVLTFHDGGDMVYVAAQIGPIYDSSLEIESHVRQLWFYPGYELLVVRDRLKSPLSHRYAQLWHFGGRAKPVSRTTFMVTSGHNWVMSASNRYREKEELETPVYLTPLRPRDARINCAWTTINPNYNVRDLPMFQHLQISTEGAGEIEFLTALTPEPPERLELDPQRPDQLVFQSATANAPTNVMLDIAK